MGGGVVVIMPGPSNVRIRYVLIDSAFLGKSVSNHKQASGWGKIIENAVFKSSV